MLISPNNIYEKTVQVAGDVFKTVESGYLLKKIASLYYDAIHETCRTVLHNTCQSKNIISNKKIKRWHTGSFSHKCWWQISENGDISIANSLADQSGQILFGYFIQDLIVGIKRTLDIKSIIWRLARNQVSVIWKKSIVHHISKRIHHWSKNIFK